MCAIKVWQMKMDKTTNELSMVDLIPSFTPLLFDLSLNSVLRANAPTKMAVQNLASHVLPMKLSSKRTCTFEPPFLRRRPGPVSASHS